MGSKSRRFRARETMDSELVYLYLLLLLCLGSLRRSANYGHTYQSVYREAIVWEQGPSEILATANSGAFVLEQGPNEILTIANPGAFVLEQGTSEVIALANSASNMFGKYSSAVNFLSQEERELASMAPSIEYDDHSLDRLKLDSSGDVLALNSFRLTPNETRFLESFEDESARSGRSAQSAERSAFNCSIYETLLSHESKEIMDIIKTLCHIDEFSNVTGVAYYERGLSPDNDSELRAKVISILVAGIIIFLIILTMARKRIRNVILFISNNEFKLQELDLDESYLADQILYENLLKEAVLVSSQGSSGKVFKVRFLELDCAMKVFHSNARMDIRKESITLLNLSHPHVVKFFCSFRKSFIIMELMDEDLYSFITKIRERRIDYDMPLEVALDVMLQIAEGMSYLHQQGIAHQDLKSLNILLKLRGELDDPDFQILAKVADLGSARRFDPRYPKGFALVPHMNIGTRSWRAPELFDSGEGFMSNFLGVNPRVLPKPLDIYGFAIICSELLTKQIPFSNDKDLRLAVLASKLREGHRPALPSTGCPEELLALIKDCWHRDPVLRPEFHEVRTRLIEVKSSLMSRGQRPES